MVSVPPNARDGSHELIKLAKEMREAAKRGEDLGLNDDDVCLYGQLRPDIPRYDITRFAAHSRLKGDSEEARTIAMIPAQIASERDGHASINMSRSWSARCASLGALLATVLPLFVSACLDWADRGLKIRFSVTGVRVRIPAGPLTFCDMLGLHGSPAGS